MAVVLYCTFYHTCCLKIPVNILHNSYYLNSPNFAFYSPNFAHYSLFCHFRCRSGNQFFTDQSIRTFKSSNVRYGECSHEKASFETIKKFTQHLLPNFKMGHVNNTGRCFSGNLSPFVARDDFLMKTQEYHL